MKRVNESRAIGKMLFMSGGLLVWALHFTLIYGFTTLACARTFAAHKVLGMGVVPIAVGGATILAWLAAGAFLVIAAAGAVPPRSLHVAENTEQFFRYTTAIIAILSLVAIGWNALPVLVVSPC